METMLLSSLRPTQMTVGFAYVEVKSIITQRHGGTALEPFLRDHAIRVVRGPEGTYIVDHHHWAFAWHRLGIVEAPVRVQKDYRDIDSNDFWALMRKHGWLHLFDERGQRCELEALPNSLDGMQDDPYHSLAALARRAGAYRKPKRAYISFVWANYMRDRVKIDSDTPGAFSLALLEAMRVAREENAADLPGYIGPK
ncbi:ParB/Srx family N-terminal domain-containing protein [Trinickia symbiotica]|nr:ParB/Srx family N-terminal domain-containing protein [Trinickia symbiotica]